MSECPLESLTVKYFSKWLSFTVIKTLQPQQKNWFRKLENSLTKLVKIKNHLKFNETCIKNKLLPTYTTNILSQTLQLESMLLLGVIILKWGLEGKSCVAFYCIIFGIRKNELL